MKAYISSVSSSATENYEIGIRVGVWGVEERYRNRIAPVRPGDLLIFVVEGRFRSAHPILSTPYHDNSIVWPPKNGDPFPHRVQIGEAIATGSVHVGDLAASISFMQGKVFWGTLRGQNGVFNPHATPEDIEFILQAFDAPAERAMEVLPTDRTDDSPPERPESPSRIVPVPPDRWLDSLLDELAALENLRATGDYADPFGGADKYRSGLLTGVYTDPKETPTVAVAKFDRSPSDTIVSTLYGLSSLKGSRDGVKEVRGVIFVPEKASPILDLVRGVPNLTAVEFDVYVGRRIR